MENNYLLLTKRRETSLRVFDQKVFVEVPERICHKRLVKRWQRFRAMRSNSAKIG